jgi:hypothetical protein
MIRDEFIKTGFHSDEEVFVKTTDDANSKNQSRIDILLSPNKKGDAAESTPLAVIEVGRIDSEWWSKLDQNMKYIEKLGTSQKDPSLRFEKPLLCVVLTIDNNKASGELLFKLGVFLCSPKESSGTRTDFRMTLLWHVETMDLGKASEAFGRLLRATSDFNRWRESDDKPDYEYFSSNCCRVGEYVSA